MVHLLVGVDFFGEVGRVEAATTEHLVQRRREEGGEEAMGAWQVLYYICHGQEGKERVDYYIHWQGS